MEMKMMMNMLEGAIQIFQHSNNNKDQEQLNEYTPSHVNYQKEDSNNVQSYIAC